MNCNFMSTSSKTPSINLEKTKTINEDDDDDGLNEDIEDYLGVWIKDQTNSLNTLNSNKSGQEKVKRQKKLINERHTSKKKRF